MKTVLITIGNIKSTLVKRIKYDKIYIINGENKKKENEENNNKDNGKIKYLLYKDLKEIPKLIDTIFKEEPNSMILPYFSGDSKSKYAIKIYNKYFGTKIESKLFKEKDKMNSFIGHEKKHLKLNYNEIIECGYLKISKYLGERFILKPTNAASSLLNFMISSKDDFKIAKKKLKKSYNYILEEYLDGNLYSIDLYLDGNNIFVTSFVREITFYELLERFSKKYKEIYGNIINENFLHFIPIRYTLDFNKISSLEINFIKNVTKGLIDLKYKGFIHLEYKIDRKNNKIGFIEWGARLGWKRSYFIREMFNVIVQNIPYYLLYEKDLSKFEKKKGVYFLKERDPDKNLLGIKTNVMEKTHLMNLIKKTPNFLSISFEEHLKDIMRDYWKIKFDEIDFSLKTSSDYYIYPYFQRNDTRFDYIMKLNEKNFKLFLKKKHSILEKLVFHDY